MERLILRGDIYMVNLGMGFESVQGGIRPCIVVSNNTGNYYSSILMIAPVTTQQKNKLPTHVKVDTNTGLPRKSTALYEQIFVVSKSQLRDKVGHKDMTRQDDKAIAIALGINGNGELEIKPKEDKEWKRHMNITQTKNALV